jgi:hypothetical protein
MPVCRPPAGWRRCVRGLLTRRDGGDQAAAVHPGAHRAAHGRHEGVHHRTDPSRRRGLRELGVRAALAVWRRNPRGIYLIFDAFGDEYFMENSVVGNKPAENLCAGLLVGRGVPGVAVGVTERTEQQTLTSRPGRRRLT